MHLPIGFRFAGVVGGIKARVGVRDITLIVSDTPCVASGVYTTNQIVAYITTFSVFLFLWVISWLGSFSTGWFTDVTAYLSIIEHFDDFSKGVVDTTHVIYYLSLITFGLFLTAKSVDTERWRG